MQQEKPQQQQYCDERVYIHSHVDPLPTYLGLDRHPSIHSSTSRSSTPAIIPSLDPSVPPIRSLLNLNPPTTRPQPRHPLSITLCKSRDLRIPFGTLLILLLPGRDDNLGARREGRGGVVQPAGAARRVCRAQLAAGGGRARLGELARVGVDVGADPGYGGEEGGWGGAVDLLQGGLRRGTG